MSLKKIYFALCLLLITGLSAFAQTDTIGLKTIIAKTVKLSNEHPVEKVYLHFDKPFYAIGDTIWFKAYLTIDLHQPSPLSKIVYVDVISSKDSIVQTLRLQVNNSVAFGDVELLPSLYKQGNYHIRAYTNWMRNDDPAYFFNKTFAVGNFNNQIATNIILSGSSKNNTGKVSAKVIYKDPTGKPLANKKVSWKVLNDDESISKGKGVTSANGVLDVNFTTNKTAEVATSALVTVIDITDDKSLTSSFSLAHSFDQPDIQFLPEGGELVAGIKSRVAFKAIKPDGLGMDIKGTITDNNGAVVTEFASTHLGMGVFTMQPDADKSYKANVTYPDGSQATINLPKVQADAMALSIYNNDPQSLTLKLSASPVFFEKNKGKSFYIIAQVGQIVCFAAQTNLQNSIYTAPLALTKFPSGVIKFTLLSDHGEPLAERITFVQRNDLLNITMKSPQGSYTARQKVTMSVLAQKDAQPSEANLSVTILDEIKVPFDENAETTILTDLLLTSELKGFIEKPNYYFIKPDDKTKADLDILMLTQGYRRFSYKDIIANKFPENKFLPEQGISVSGTIRNATGLPINRGNLTLLANDRPLKSTVANTVGEFKFANLTLPDSTKVTVNAKNNANANNLLIIIDNNSSMPVTPNVNAPAAIANIDSAMSTYLQNSKQQFANSRVLKTVTISEKSIEKKPSHFDYPQLTGLDPNPDHVIPGSQLNACSALAQCLMGGVLGVTYDNNNLYVTRGYNSGDKKPMAIYYNGLNVDYDYLNSVAPADVESIEVFLTDGLSGVNKMSNTSGVLVINGKKVVKKTMTRDQINKTLAEFQNSAQSITLKGYSQSRVFYAPRYDPGKSSTFGGDLRTTIFWNPKVVTDKTGAATFDFYNADGKGSYRAIIEGIDNNGNIGRAVYRYKVQ